MELLPEIMLLAIFGKTTPEVDEYALDGFVEYDLKGPLKTGVTTLYTLGFAAARDTMPQPG